MPRKLNVGITWMPRLLMPCSSFSSIAPPAYPLYSQKLMIGERQWSVQIPEPYAVQQQYVQRSATNAHAPFPYWAKLWPSAIAMAQFLIEHPQEILGKKVVEIAGGIGLPSLVAAGLASEVICSDISEEAVSVAACNAQLLGLYNMQCRCFGWQHLPPQLTADVLLLSDVNYDSRSFEDLHQMLFHFLQQNTTILLSTPLRLQARSFLERLMPYCQRQEVVQASMPGEPVQDIYVFQLGAS